MNIPTIETITGIIEKIESLKEKETGFEKTVILVDETASKEESEVEQFIRAEAGCKVELSAEVQLGIQAGYFPVRKKIAKLSINALRRLLKVTVEVFKDDMIKDIRNDQILFTKKGYRLDKTKDLISCELQTKKRKESDKRLFVYWDYFKEKGSWEKDKQAYIKRVINSGTPLELDSVIQELANIKSKVKTEAKQEKKENVFRNDGDRWTVVFNHSNPCYIDDTKGMRQIAQLLAKPHKTISAVELANPQNNTVSDDSGSPQKKIDGETLIACRKRLTEIPEELTKAEKDHDSAAKKRLQKEKEGILDYVRTSTRPSGQSGSFNNNVEKARKAVSSNINRAIDNIKQHNPTLYRHLDNSIQQGKDLAYKPDTETSWEL